MVGMKPKDRIELSRAFRQMIAGDKRDTVTGKEKDIGNELKWI